MTKNTKDLMDSWFELVEEKKLIWMKEFFKHVENGHYWDVGFETYVKFKVFCFQFEDDINESLKEIKLKEPDVTFDQVAHDMFLDITKDVDGLIDDVDRTINDMPRA